MTGIPDGSDRLQRTPSDAERWARGESKNEAMVSEVLARAGVDEPVTAASVGPVARALFLVTLAALVGLLTAASLSVDPQRERRDQPGRNPRAIAGDGGAQPDDSRRFAGPFRP